MSSHTVQHRVLYAETDTFGVVYNVNYLVWFESARTELIRQSGTPYSKMEEQGYALPVVKTGASFHKSARYDDLVSVTAVVAWVRGASLRIDYEVHLDDDRLAKGFTTHAFTNLEGRPVRMPAHIRELFSELT